MATQVNATLIEAHRRAVGALRRGSGAPRIGVCLQLVPLLPLRPDDEADVAAATWLQQVMTDSHLDDLSAGGDGGDFVGVQYYTRARVDARLPELIAPAPPEAVESTQMGWEVHPAGFAAMVRRAAQTGLPVVVTENGIATTDDAQRLRFLRSHLAELKRVMDEGIDVRGYLHWSAFDNFEWNHGHAPRFGLIGIDRADGLRRVVRPSALAYGRLARTGVLAALTAESETLVKDAQPVAVSASA